jgi:hypothetical protein
MNEDDSTLRRRFNANPKEVVDEYKLDDTEAAEFFTMKLEAVAEAVKQQIISFGFPFKGDFPACSEEYTPELGESEPEYPKPIPGVYRIRPRTAKYADIVAAGNQVELVVTGKSFARRNRPQDKISARIRRLSDKVEWDVGANLYGTFRCSRLHVVVAPKPGESDIKKDDYKIIVVNNGKDLWRGYAENDQSKKDVKDFKVE